jgi:hypothetical protein
VDRQRIPRGHKALSYPQRLSVKRLRLILLKKLRARIRVRFQYITPDSRWRYTELLLPFHRAGASPIHRCLVGDTPNPAARADVGVPPMRRDYVGDPPSRWSKIGLRPQCFRSTESCWNLGVLSFPLSALPFRSDSWRRATSDSLYRARGKGDGAIEVHGGRTVPVTSRGGKSPLGRTRAQCWQPGRQSSRKSPIFTAMQSRTGRCGQVG